MPLEGVTLTPGAEADQEVEPVMAEPPFVIVNSTCPVLALHAPLTVILDLSQVDEAGVFVAVAVKVGVRVIVGEAIGEAVGDAVDAIEAPDAAAQVASALAEPLPGWPGRWLTTMDTLAPG